MGDRFEESVIAKDTRKIIFFDGECGLCHGFVQFVMKRDRSRAFWFAPLQGDTYRTMHGDAGPTDLSTVVLSDAHGIHVRSEAVLRVLCHLGVGWRILGQIGFMTPRPIRDWAYGMIARNRHRIKINQNVCGLPRSRDLERMMP
jgi:predicted DCC family thiol-disulfide oxidoreductase YuxK